VETSTNYNNGSNCRSEHHIISGKKLHAGDGFYRVENKPKSISARDLSQTPLRKLTALPRALVVRGAQCRSPRIPSQLRPFRPHYLHSVTLSKLILVMAMTTTCGELKKPQ